MKNVVKSALVVLTMGMFAVPASAECFVAIPVNTQDTIVKKDTVVKKEGAMLLAQDEVVYSKIEVAQVPEKVSTAVTSKYEGYAIETAEKGSDNSYRLVVKKGDAQLTVYFNEAGEFMKEESAKTEESILV